MNDDAGVGIGVQRDGLAVGVHGGLVAACAFERQPEVDVVDGDVRLTRGHLLQENRGLTEIAVVDPRLEPTA